MSNELIAITYQHQTDNWSTEIYYTSKDGAVQEIEQIMQRTMRQVLPIKAVRILHIGEDDAMLEQPLHINYSVELQETNDR